MALTKEQVAERQHYLGGSDAAAALGLSRWKTPIELWAEKTGAVAPADISDRLPIRVGDKLEDLVASLFMEETGKKVHRVNEIQKHKKHDFIRAQIDRRVVGEDAILECKTAGAWAAKRWEGEEIPQEYLVQCLHQMNVMGKSKCYIAVLIGGNTDFIWKEIDRDEDLINRIEAAEVDFWNNYVLAGKMPIVGRHDADILQKLYPDSIDADPIPLGEDADAIADSLEALRKDRDNIEGIMAIEQNKLRAMLGESAAGESKFWKISWKTQSRNGLDTKGLSAAHPEIAAAFKKTTSSRVFRMTRKKGE